MDKKKSDTIKEKELWSAYQIDPSEINREALIVFYLRFVRYICGRIAIDLPSHVKEEDLLSSGVEGLMDAIEKFDPTRDNLFRTYAYNRIRGAVIDELRRLDWAPRSLRRKAKEFEKTEGELEQRFGRKVTPDEIAEEMNVSREEVDTVYRDVKTTALLSLDEVIKNSSVDKATKRMDMIENKKSLTPKQVLEQKELKELLAKKIEDLPKKEKLVIVLYYYEELTLKEIGAVLEVSESRISQLHSQAIERVVLELKKDLGE